MENTKNIEMKAVSAFDIQEALRYDCKVRRRSTDCMDELASALMILSATGGTLTLTVGTPDYPAYMAHLEDGQANEAGQALETCEILKARREFSKALARFGNRMELLALAEHDEDHEDAKRVGKEAADAFVQCESLFKQAQTGKSEALEHLTDADVRTLNEAMENLRASGLPAIEETKHKLLKAVDRIVENATA